MTLRANMLARFKPASLRVVALQFNNLQGCNLAQVDIKQYSKEHAKFCLNFIFLDSLWHSCLQF